MQHLFPRLKCLSVYVKEAEEMRHITFMKGARNTYNIQLENPKGGDHLSYLVVGGGLILN